MSGKRLENFPAGAELGHHDYPSTKLSTDLKRKVNDTALETKSPERVVGVVADYERNLNQTLRELGF